MDEGKLVGAGFTDMSKTFDTISHSNLVKNHPNTDFTEKSLIRLQITISTGQWL